MGSQQLALSLAQWRQAHTLKLLPPSQHAPEKTPTLCCCARRRAPGSLTTAPPPHTAGVAHDTVFTRPALRADAALLNCAGAPTALGAAQANIMDRWLFSPLAPQLHKYRFAWIGQQKKRTGFELPSPPPVRVTLDLGRSSAPTGNSAKRTVFSAHLVSRVVSPVPFPGRFPRALVFLDVSKPAVLQCWQEQVRVDLRALCRGQVQGSS